MIFSYYFDWFIFFSFLGWIFESAYCTINEHEWQNRGFLYGPVVPIYGSGVTALMLVSRFLPHNPPWYAVFLISFFGSMILEYGTSWALEKLFHARWWDYGKMPLNINGRICLPASMMFGLAGLFLYTYFLPLLPYFSEKIPPLLAEAVSLILMLLLGADIGITVNSIKTLADRVRRINNEVNRQFADAYKAVENGVTGGMNTILDARDQLINSRIAREAAESTPVQMMISLRIKSIQATGTVKEIGERMLKEMRSTVKTSIRSRQNEYESQKREKDI